MEKTIIIGMSNLEKYYNLNFQNWCILYSRLLVRQYTFRVSCLIYYVAWVGERENNQGAYIDLKFKYIIFLLLI